MSRTRLVDVAARAGVSTATASLVLRGRPGPSRASVEAVRAAATALDYRPDRTASLLARQRTDLVGVVLDVASPFHAELVLSLDASLSTIGLDMLLAVTTARQSETDAVEKLVDSRCEAVVILGPQMSGASLAAIADRVPTIAVGRGSVGAARGILADDAAGIDAAVGHLASLGHRSLAYLDGPRGSIGAARRRACQRAARRHGVTSLRVVRSGDSEASGAAAWPHVAAAAPRATAVVAYNDRAAIGCRDAALHAGVRIPQDLSIVGYDDSPPARLATVDLTSVSQNPDQLAEACRRLLEGAREGSALLRGPDLVVTPRLVVRGSSVRPPDGLHEPLPLASRRFPAGGGGYATHMSTDPASEPIIPDADHGDLAEQATEVEPSASGPDLVPTDSLEAGEANEADVLEQQQEVPDDEEMMDATGTTSTGEGTGVGEPTEAMDVASPEEEQPA